MLSIKANAALLAFAATTLFGFISAQVGGSKDLFKCRQSCYQKFVKDWHHCMDFEDCKNCWNSCDQQLGPFQLHINSAVRQGSLVVVDIGWDEAITNVSDKCLVTWEVSGGGLMGNLLTDSSSVELSLWLDTVHHVQVTCKHKETGGMRRSHTLIVDTHKLSDDSSAMGLEAIALDTSLTSNSRKYTGVDSNANTNSAETDSRMRILKDSAKDFLSPYNPNAVTKESISSTSPKVQLNSGRQPHDSVLTSKTDLPIRRQAEEFLTESIVFAIVGSLVLFFGLLVVYALTRPLPKDVPLVARSIDKELLINSELLPSQTPAARAAASNPAIPTSLTHATTASMSMSESRTLHV